MDRLLAGPARVRRSVVSPRPGGPDAAICLDDDLVELRDCARSVGALRGPEPGPGWFGRALRERLARARRVEVADDAELDARASALIARACRATALSGGLSSAGAHVGELATLVTEGLAAPVGVPAAIAAVTFDRVHAAAVQIDLACDLAALHGVPFDLGDVGELASVFAIVLGTTRPRSSARAAIERVIAPDDNELLARIGRGLLEDALLGMVPLVGMPCSAARNYFATRKLGARMLAHVRRRRAVRRRLAAALASPLLDKRLLLEGAWLLATCDDDLTHDEALILSTIFRSIPRAERPRLQTLRHVGEGIWVVQMALLDDARRDAVLRALHDVASLRGESGAAERALLERLGQALG